MNEFERVCYEQDGFLVLEGFLPAADCDALQARAAALVAGFDAGAQRTVFSTRDQEHARDRYFRESGGDIRFFFEEEASGQLNKIGHALHDLDPVFDRVSRLPEIAALASDLGLAEPLLLQSMYLFKQPRIGGEVGWHQDATYLRTEPPSVTGLWFALDDADRDNGCLMVLPAMHREPLRQWFGYDGDAHARYAAVARRGAAGAGGAARHADRPARAVAACQRAQPLIAAASCLCLASDRWPGRLSR